MTFMKPKKFYVFLLFMVLPASALLWALPRVPEWERQLMEWGANQAADEFFQGSIRLEKAGVNRHMRLTIENIRAELKTQEGKAPIRIRSLVSDDPVTYFLMNRPVKFRFEGLKTQTSSYDGIQGEMTLKGGKDGFLDFRSEVRSLGLEDITFLNPDNLSGSTGKMTGSMTFHSDARQDPALGMELLVQEPGGKIQGQFFEMLLPYLPQMQSTERVKALASKKALVNYKNAALIVSLKESDKMKVFLHILVPDYNLNLNLNLEIRTDKKNAFLEIAQLFGLIEVAVR